MLWDDENIYIAAVVTDDKLSMNKTDGNIWNSDCIEVLFATTDAEAAHSWTNPTIHYQYGFNANDQTWNWCNMDGPGQSVPDYLQAASSITADGYICEVSIRHSEITPLDWSAGSIIGFHPCIDDTDIDNGDTEYQMSWTGLPAHDQSQGFGHLVLSADPVPPPEPINPGAVGLVASYALDGDANDSSGNELNGVIIGDPNFVEGADGMALDLDGVDDVVELGTFDVVGGITLAAWIRPDDFEINDARIISKANEWSGDSHWWMVSTISETSLRFRLKTDEGPATATLVSDPVLEAGVFTHVAATWDGSMMRLYKDGVEIASQEKAGTAVAVDPNISVAIGSQPSDAFASDPSHVVKFFDGLIDDVRIYDRALSEGELLYLAGARATPVNPGADGLTAFYALDGDPNDSSGNGNDGTLFGDQLEWVAGTTGGALSHGGLSDAGVEIPTTGMSPTAGTVAMWGLLTDPQPAETKYFFGHTTQPQWSNRVQLYMDNGDNLLDLGLGDSHNRQNDIVELPLEQWLHVALTWDSGNYVVYLDGESVATGVYTGFTDVNEVANIGNDGSRAPYEAFGGLLDEVAIYSRALSAGEVRYLAGFRDNLLQNSSFEEDEDILDDPTWEQWCTWNPAEGAGSNATIVDTEAADGAKSLLVEPVGPENWHFILVNISFQADLSENYTTSFWAKAQEPRPLTVQMKASDNSVSAWGGTGFDLTTEWAQYSYTSEVQHTDVKLEFLCAGSEVPFWLDQVLVYVEE
ncbi:MAG: LamG-like jellyroll fold domain-containing protein [Planctomycetota bacterium]|jgi:hypothetical protein